MTEVNNGTMSHQIHESIPGDPELVGDGDGDGNDDDDDMDSAYDSESINTSLASLTESIVDYRQLHGRTYQRSRSTVYWGPNDRQQIEGLDLTHHWMTLLLDDKLHLAPLPNSPQRVLDVGTGTGLWAIDFADANPSAEVIGTDISPIQPTWVPPNCRFILEDAQLDWTWQPDYFDFIHMRHMIGAIDDWHKLYRQVFTHLKPGGWFQHCEFDITTRSDTGLVGPDHVFNKWCNLFFEAGKVTGRGFQFPVQNGQMKDLMESTGFVDVVHRSWKVPIGGWARDMKMKQLGLFTFEFIDSSLEGFALYLLMEILHWEYDDIQQILGVMQKALRRNKLMPYFILHLTCGRKP